MCNIQRLSCVNSVQQNIKCGIKGDKYFVDEVETQLREKPLRGSQTQEFHYSEDKARYKTVTVVQILIFILLASARIVLQYSVMQVRGRSHKELCCEN